MNIDLMDFQDDAVRVLLAELRFARLEVAERDKAQAIILSSPTGSGKTVTITALLERVLTGDETHAADPQAVFLWLSDAPELNAQSRDKIIAQSSVFREQDLILVEPSFSQELLESGKVYFLNTQKLSKDSLLTKSGDEREYTIWQTIENTAQSRPDHFYLVIDEAHRGMDLSARELKQAQTIVQRFIFGWPEVGLSPVRIVIGISATPKRFAEVLKGSNRTTRIHDVPPQAVRGSGLLKDRVIVFCPEESQPSDWTLLSEAAKRWRRFRTDWRKYCKEQSIDAVAPALVIQVEDAAEGKLTRTDLSKAVEILEREIGQFGAGALAHCFEIEGPVTAGGHQIRKIEASKIQQDHVAQVIFFKMALSTGWDCPRAEAMMSFRKAKDHTSIAQLVGRMVRSPLARRIEGSELLNTVSLYLPHYDKDGLRAIIEKLNDPENAPPTEVELHGADLVNLTRNPKHSDLFEALADLPSYSVDRVPKTSNVRRLIKLARQLTSFDEIDPSALPEAKALVINTLSGELERLRRDKIFDRVFKENQVIELREVQIEAGDWKEIGEGKITRVKASPENIEDLFDVCGRLLGEGLHKEFWKEKSDKENPQRTKVELYGLLQDPATWKKLEEVARDRVDELFERFKREIKTLPTSRQEEYNHLRRRAKDPTTIPILFPPSFEVPREKPTWEQHLYVDEGGSFGWDANSWETAVLKEEMQRKDFLAWLRNFPRKPWSCCVPYWRRGERRPMFPDLLVFRRVKGRIELDLLDPHWPGLPDAPEKAVGLAQYAEQHGDFFGRIELIRRDEREQVKRLNLQREKIRDEVKKVKDGDHLLMLFDSLG